MTGKLFIQAILKFIAGVILVGAMIFLPAGTLAFGKGWLLMGVLFIPMFFAGIVMMVRSPELLKKRLSLSEKRREQGIIVKLSGLMFIAGFIIAGLDFRFGWSYLPGYVSLVAAAVFIAAYLIYAEVLRENAYLSRTIEVQQGQKVIDTGLYGIVRHPMYSATLLLFGAMPLILGSLPAFVIFLTYPVMISARLLNEEKLLKAELSGYEEYTKKVRYRLIPFIW